MYILFVHARNSSYSLVLRNISFSGRSWPTWDDEAKIQMSANRWVADVERILMNGRSWPIAFNLNARVSLLQSTAMQAQRGGGYGQSLKIRTDPLGN
jgi:hypothetical protein